MRTLLVLAVLATVTACGGGGDSDSRRDRDEARSERDRDGNSERDGDRSSRDDRDRREADPELEDELRAEVRQFRETLPAREGVLTITDVDLDGTEIIYTGRVGANFDRAAIAEFRRVVSRDLCTGEPGEMIRRGGSFTYNLRDEDGDDFETTVSSCD